MIYLGDSLHILSDLPSDSVDAVVTDPPYFLTNSGGSGFMGKEWDSLSVANAFAESVLRHLSPVWLMAEENSVLEPVSTSTPLQKPEKNIHALCAVKNLTDPQPKLSLGTFSVLDRVLTKAEVLALSSALCPSLTSVIESQPANVLYVVPTLFQQKEPIAIARDVALKLVTAKICEDLKTLHSLMGDQKTKSAIAATTGSASGSKFTSATDLDVKNVESTVAEKRYSVTTSCPIDYQKIIRWITSLRFVKDATALFTANPGNIQLLSERFHYAWLSEVFRVLKPGGHILAFAGTRTYHRLVVAAEDAGFEIRDQVQWIYGSGFPKSLNLKGEWEGFGTALKPANEPIVLARKPLEKGLTVAENVLKYGTGAINVDAGRIASGADHAANCARTFQSGIWAKSGEGKKEVTTEANAQGRWPANVLFDEDAAVMLDEQSGVLKQGVAGNKSRPFGDGSIYGTAKEFKPNNSTTYVCDKPSGASRFFYVAKASKRERNAGLDKTDLIWENDAWEKQDLKSALADTLQLAKGISEDILTDESLWSIDGFGNSITDQSLPALTSTIKIASKLITELKTSNAFQSSSIRESIQGAIVLMEASGLSLAESAESINQLRQNITNEKTASALGVVLALLLTLSKIKSFARSGNFHSTVKPIKLMEYLIKLITPPGGVVLDPFMGSGSTGVAAKNLGFKFIGIELEPEYVEIARRRLEHHEIPYCVEEEFTF